MRYEKWELERSNQDTKIYSGSVTKLLFALLHSPSTQLESSMHYVNKLPLSGETVQHRLSQFPTLS
jgi:hypothetical protein